ALTGPAREAVRFLEVPELIKEDGVKTVIKALTSAFEPYQETALPRAMETALYGHARAHKERSRSVDLPSKAKGYLLYRQSNLDKELDARLLTWLAGDYSEDVVVANLRRLDRAIQEGSRKNNAYYEGLEEDDAGDAEGEWQEHEAYYEDYGNAIDDDEALEETYYQDPAPDEAFQDVVEEDELLEVLASYQDVRDSLRMARNGRGYYPKGSKGSFGPLPSGKGKQKGQGAGHADRPATGLVSAGLLLHSRLRRQGTGQHDKEPEDAASAKDSSLPFIGVATQSFQGIVDTAAQEGLVGKPALLRLLEELRKQGLRGYWNGKTSEARGIGGRATSLGTVEVPVGFGGIAGILELTVVAEDVPLLVPVNLLKALGAVIDLDEGLLHLRKVNTVCDMSFLSSGHPVISIIDFGKGWHLPEVCREFSSPIAALALQLFGQQLLEEAATLMLTNRALGVQRSPARQGQWQLVGPAPGARARRNWRVVLDKLSCVLQWARWQELVSTWLPLPELGQRQSQPLPSGPTSSTTTSSTRLAPTDKGAAYKRYLQERKPEQLSAVKGADGFRGEVPAPSAVPERCRWKLSPRTAAVFTGRPLEPAEEIAENPNLAARVQEMARDALEKEHLDQQDQLLQIIADQREKIEETQAQLDMQNGHFLERQKTLEEETRQRANFFPTSETKEQWEQTAPGRGEAGDAALSVDQDPMHGRSTEKGDGTLNKATPTVLRRWLVEPNAFLEDFVVVRERGFLVRGDRHDMKDERGDHGEVYVVLKEPELYVNAEFSEDGPKEAQDVVIDGIQAFLADNDGQDELCLKPVPGNDQECWRRFEEARPELLTIEPEDNRESHEMACRLARGSME
ncbi:GIP, partial [Symbiodinium necroappetens]